MWFSNYLAPLNELEARLNRRKTGYVQLRGNMKMKKREEAVEKFRRDPGTPFLLASTQVGGEGLNLVEANHVVFVNRWWNPSANRQAKDRVARMGQERTVVVHSFTCRDTVEEHLDQILATKVKLTASIIEGLADPLGDASIAQEVVRRLVGGAADPT